jgi:hypothetical protein
MARSGQHQRQMKSAISELETFAAFLLATAEDDDEELIAIATATFTLEQRCARRFNKCYGRRSPYNQPKSEDFFRILPHEASNRIFKAWFRWDILG